VPGVAIAASEFAGIGLPAHLSMNFRIRDDAGRTLAESRDLLSIQREWTGAARVAFSRRADVELTREDVGAFDFEEIPDRVISPGGLTAFPALVDLGESVALRVFERRDEAMAAHRGGVERLLRRTLADPVKRAQRQLPLDNALMLKWAPLGSAESLRADLVEGALRELFAAHDLDIRERGAFEHTREEIARALFARATERLAIAEDIIAGYAEVKPLLEPPLMGFARANYDDLRDQLDELLAPGFVRERPLARLAHFPRYLGAMRLRAERLRQDPARDQARMLTVQLYWRDYLKLRAKRGGDAALEELRWLIEELRVSTFAQELGTAEKVSPKRLAKLAEDLRAETA
jgi:ATP-dependent helicase HrpA